MPERRASLRVFGDVLSGDTNRWTFAVEAERPDDTRERDLHSRTDP